MYRSDPAVAVDHKRSRKRFHSAILIARLVVAEHNAIVDLFLRDEWTNHFPSIVVHGNTDNGEATILVFALEFSEPGNLDPARAAPGGPEVEQHDLASIIGEVNDLAVGILEREIGSSLAVARVLYG
jgi:hypothetical protein